MQRAFDRQSALGFTTIHGLPAHILIVHLVVVFVPLAALALVAALRPAYAERLGLVLPALGIVAFLSVLAAMNAGGWLQNHVQDTALVRHHTQIAGQLWPFSAAVAVLSLVVWWFASRPAAATVSGDGPRAGVATAVAIGVLSVVMAVISVVQVVRIGDSGAQAAWHNHFSRTALHQGG